ncbi:MAG: histidine kinase dimerization/phospho-acceptor domain-containing protein [Dehalococcoidales bacterium]
MSKFLHYVTFALIVMLSGVHPDAIIITIVRKNIDQIELENPDSSKIPSLNYSYGKDDGESVENIDKIAHDIRGSVNVIIGYSQIMLDEVNGKINPEQRQALQDILTCGNHLFNLTDNMLKRLDSE